MARLLRQEDLNDAYKLSPYSRHELADIVSLEAGKSSYVLSSTRYSPFPADKAHFPVEKDIVLIDVDEFLSNSKAR